MSASGEKSFTEPQVRGLKNTFDVDFLQVLSPLGTEEFIGLAKDAEILAVTRRSIRDFNRAMIDALPKLRALAIYSTGYEWVDLDHMREKGIAVSFLPDYCTISVAEHTLTMILTMMHRTHMSYDKVRGLIPEETSLRGYELQGKSIGIIGFGHIGSEIARLLSAMGTSVHYYDERNAQRPAAGFLPLTDLLAVSDLVVLSCSKKRRAKPVIGSRELALMKKGAFLINPARSDLVDTRAVIDALKEKRLMGYAVDDDIGDFSAELDYGRVLQTGHTAWYSTEAIERGTDKWVKNIIGMADSTACRHANIL
jgi:lactate dehydrogenase-like 2-hydroxyacid dehydrogenase